MESETTNEVGDHLVSLKKVTPLSRYLALALFTTLPFLGGWIGYMYAPDKVMEVEQVVAKSSLLIEENKKLSTENTDLQESLKILKDDIIALDVAPSGHYGCPTEHVFLHTTEISWFEKIKHDVSEINENGAIHFLCQLNKDSYVMSGLVHSTNEYGKYKPVQFVVLYESGELSEVFFISKKMPGESSALRPIYADENILVLFLGSGDGGLRSKAYYVLDMHNFSDVKEYSFFTMLKGYNPVITFGLNSGDERDIDGYVYIHNNDVTIDIVQNHGSSTYTFVKEQEEYITPDVTYFEPNTFELSVKSSINNTDLVPPVVFSF